ncbi:dead end protein 1 [Lampris incognitus]|uniref:dead end protein 1 n=1 Tax=Lampris incognitus TaxID=2546036 RepID=UPI0024B48FDD|nr:dead end protein 1 [Lampris incognitus]
MNSYKFKVTQVNGQRKYGGPPDDWQGPAPGAGCEVYITKIPRDTYEDQLIPLFNTTGPLWEFRLMMNFSGQNRGFAYAKYGSPAHAAEAIRLMDGCPLKRGVHLKVCLSTEKRQLCLEGLKISFRQEELMQVLRVLTEGVKDVFLKTESALVLYSSHHAASMAKKVLVEAFKKNWSLTISVKWHFSTKSWKGNPKASQTCPEYVQLLPSKPPSHILDSPRTLLPDLPQVFTPGSDRAKTENITNFKCTLYSSLSPSSQVHIVSTEKSSPVFLLHKLCQMHGVGNPQFELHCEYVGPGGFLYFNYKVHVPGVTMPFSGEVRVLPALSVKVTIEEACDGVAKKVLQTFNKL